MNKYEILDIIDQGAYGIVWKALNRQTGAIVAIKEFKDGDDDEISRRTIQRQIKMLKMLKGEYVVEIKEAFKKKGKIYLIFQFFEKNILNLIELYETGLDPQLIRTIVYKSIKCLRFLHHKNIIHRDVKPQNILINNTYTTLKLCDFGFARFIPQTNDLTEYVATRWYRSPELLVGEFYGKPADIWALGCILGELVDGQPMFPGQNEMDQLFLIKKALGSLTSRQIQYLTKNPKFLGISFPPMRKQQSVQAKYLGRIEKTALSFLKDCLKVDPKQRITVEEALKHPYLIELSMKDDQLVNDEQNLLTTYRRKNSINQHKQDSPALSNQQTKGTVSMDERESFPAQSKLFSNKNLLKMPGKASMPHQQLIHIDTVTGDINPIKKKKQSHDVYHIKEGQTNKKRFGNYEVSPKMKLKKDYSRRLVKVMSQQKNVNLNLDLNVKINLKLDQTGKASHQSINKLPQINSKNSRTTKYHVNMKNPSEKFLNPINNRNYPLNRNLSILGESKEITKGSKKQERV